LEESQLGGKGQEGGGRHGNLVAGQMTEFHQNCGSVLTSIKGSPLANLGQNKGRQVGGKEAARRKRKQGKEGRELATGTGHKKMQPSHIILYLKRVY